MRRLTAIALMAALSSGAFAQEALWGKAPVVSPEIHADGTVTFRIEAAKAEGISEVPCVFADYLTEAQKKAYILADNRMAMDAGWDEELLRVEIEALQAESFDVGLT